MRKSLQTLPPEEQAKQWQFLSIIFWFVRFFPLLPF
jgi:hypothetical protein